MQRISRPSSSPVPSALCSALAVFYVVTFLIFSIFQLTRPLRGATAPRRKSSAAWSISTHTPLAGRDDACLRQPLPAIHFNSHAPCGARPGTFLILPPERDFNSHAPCGARLLMITLVLPLQKFQLTRPLRGATRRFSPKPNSL